MMSDGNAAAPGGSPPPEKLLSVVIPHYNQKDFLPRAVASVLHGEPCDLEIIIVDDGSTDGSEPVLAALEGDKPAGQGHSLRDQPGRGGGAQYAASRQRADAMSRSSAPTTWYCPTCMRRCCAHSTTIRRRDLACSQLAIFGSDGSIRGVRPITPPSFRAEYLDPQTIRRPYPENRPLDQQHDRRVPNRPSASCRRFRPNAWGVLRHYRRKDPRLPVRFRLPAGHPSRISGRCQHPVRFHAA